MLQNWWFRRVVGLGAIVALTGGSLLLADQSIPVAETDSALPRTEVTPDREARLLAGLAAPAGNADANTGDMISPWAIHSRELDKAWQQGEQQRAAIGNWTGQFLGPASRDTNTVFYMFSGPDFLYAHAFFPAARSYILCGREPVGSIPKLNAIPTEQLPGILGNLRKSLGSILNWSFFITKEMKSDLTRTPLSGTLPLLYVFAARTGYTIDTVTPVSLDTDGNLADNASGKTPGVRLTLVSPSGVSQTLYYFCTDLSDDGIKSQPGFLRFCEKQGRGASLLKAASYLMHDSGFTQVRNFLLSQSDLIVQDDSGIPLRYFDDATWTIRFCGRYAGPINIFKQYWQQDLANAYGRVVPSPLPFSFGYQWQPNRSDLIITARTGTAMASLGGNEFAAVGPAAPVAQAAEIPRSDAVEDQPAAPPPPERPKPRRTIPRDRDRLPLRF